MSLTKKSKKKTNKKTNNKKNLFILEPKTPYTLIAQVSPLKMNEDRL